MRYFIIPLFLLLSYLAFGQQTDAELTTQADVIRNETKSGANSRQRVADMFQALIDSKVNVAGSKTIGLAASDETTPITAGTAKITFRMPYAMTVTGVRASLNTAQTSGTVVTVDINEGGVSILSTKLTFDNTEKTTTTAATPAVVSDTALAADAEITIDVDGIGDGTAVGLKVWIIGN